MATITITRTATCPDSFTKTDLHNQIDTATITISDIVNADIKSDAAIVDTKLATITTAGKVNTTALTTTSIAAGDLLVSNGTGWVRVAIGTAGQYLKVNATANGVEWGA